MTLRFNGGVCVTHGPFFGFPEGRYRHMTAAEMMASARALRLKNEAACQAHFRGGARVLLIGPDDSPRWVSRAHAPRLISEGLSAKPRNTPEKRAPSRSSSETRNESPAEKEEDEVENLKEVARALRKISQGSGTEASLARKALAVLTDDDNEHHENPDRDSPASARTARGYARSRDKARLDAAMGLYRPSTFGAVGNTLSLGQPEKRTGVTFKNGKAYFEGKEIG